MKRREEEKPSSQRSENL